MMHEFDKKKLVEIVLYILNKTNGLDYYHIFKIIYFANISHLAKYGISITKDDFCALPDGPVPSTLYNSIKGERFGDDYLMHILSESVAMGTDDAYYMLVAKREADTSYLSKSEIEVIDKSIKENANLPYGELRKKSHGDEWSRVYHSEQPGRKIMDIIGMARDASASEAVLEYIREQLEIEKALA